MDKTTALIHHRFSPRQTCESFMPPLQKASTIFFKNCREVNERKWLAEDYTYGLNGTPSLDNLAQKIALIEGGTHCLLVGSGLSAIALVDMALLQQGDHILIPLNAYNPNAGLVEAVLQNFGVTYSLYNPLDIAGTSAKIQKNTRLLWLEAAGSNTLEFPDLVGLVQLARQHNIITALDNTWGAGIAFCPFDFASEKGQSLGVDISIQALTKYPSGGGDVLMGSVVTRSADIYKKIKSHHHFLGLSTAANDVELVMRSLPSLKLRYYAHSKNAWHITEFLENKRQEKNSPIAQVFHPALPQSNGHIHWRTIAGDHHPFTLASCLTSFMLQPQQGFAAVEKFCDALKLFRLGFSWAGPMSLVMFYNLYDSVWQQTFYHDRNRDNTYVIRLAAGLENHQELIADIQQALDLIT